MFSVCCTIFTASFFGDGFLERNFLFLLATLCYDNLAQCVYKKVKHMFRNNLICIRRGYYVVCKDSWGPCHSVLLCPFLTSKMKTVKIPHSAPQHNMHIVQDCFVLWGQCLSKIEFNWFPIMWEIFRVKEFPTTCAQEPSTSTVVQGMAGWMSFLPIKMSFVFLIMTHVASSSSKNYL